MSSDPNPSKKKWSKLKITGVAFLVIVTAAGIYLYNNYNRLISEALLNSFNSTIVADVYELKFKKLRVNLLDRSIRVLDVSLLPREKPLREYPYINSSFELRTKEILLDSVYLRSLLNDNKLVVKKISIDRPDIELFLAGKRHIMMPFKDSISTREDSTMKDHKKKLLETFRLKEFQLIDASFHSKNTAKEREFNISKFNISLYDLLLDQRPGEYSTSFDRVTLSIGELTGSSQKGRMKHLGFKDLNINIDSLALQLNLDTLVYRFDDLSTTMRDLDIQTNDSIFHVTMQSLDLSYQNKSIMLKGMGFEPNVSHDVLQKKHRYQHAEFSGTVATLNFNQVNFDSLAYANKLFIEEIFLDSVKASVFKDKSKPLDTTRFPAYLGQVIAKIPLPIRIGKIKATHIHLDNTEQKPDDDLAKVSLTRANLEVSNITNLDAEGDLVIQADAFINDQAHFKAGLKFNYSKPQFNFDVAVDKFDLTRLNPLLLAYTPAKFNKGISDEISFSGIASEKMAAGTMKFLYHDMDIDLQLKQQAKWISSVIAFAANTATNASNPESENLPPRVVHFEVKRDMNKGFVNVLIKSLLMGLKETMIMSKENRQAYKEKVKNSKAKQ